LVSQKEHRDVYFQGLAPAGWKSRFWPAICILSHQDQVREENIMSLFETQPTSDASWGQWNEILTRWNNGLIPKDPAESSCEHEAREYVGFTERYDFCLKCDAKFIGGKWKK
jgi:hypothetical protein